MSFLHPTLIHLDVRLNKVFVPVYKASYKGTGKIKVKLVLVLNKAILQIIQMAVMTNKNHESKMTISMAYPSITNRANNIQALIQANCPHFLNFLIHFGILFFCNFMFQTTSMTSNVENLV